MMQLSDFQFDLPPELIAQYPTEKRTASRLLHVSGDGSCHDQQFVDCLEHLKAGDVLVLNNTKVIPARLYGQKATGGRLEVLIERVLDDERLLAQVRASKSPKTGTVISIDGDDSAQLSVAGRQGMFFELVLQGVDDIYQWLDQVGNIPLPPYIERNDQEQDAERYQTVFAREKGAVAAPTAGLHFDEELLKKVSDKGVHIHYVTLHVGAGTYQPVRVDNIDDHQMHREYLSVSQTTCDAIVEAKQRGNKVIAVGTTVVRSLETAAQHSEGPNLQPFQGETEIFIYPGFEFKVIDCLITNFHLSQSTLLMLVSAFCGRDVILRAYQHAIEQKYRFFSYGDAMLLEKSTV